MANGVMALAARASEVANTDTGTTVINGIINARDSISYKSVLLQLALYSGLSVAVIIGFSLVRPRQSKVYAPKIKYQTTQDPNDPDYEPPPPTLSKAFFAWVSPILNIKEQQMILNIGLDAVAFLRMVRMVGYILICCSVYGIALFAINISYNLKNVEPELRTKDNILSMFTIANVKDGWMWPALGFTYVITFTVMYFVWHNWQCMNLLRHDWFRSPQYQSKIYSRTLMVTQVPKEYRSDEGLVHLMQQLKVDGIKIAHEIDCATIGRRLDDFPDLVDAHNEAVKDLEKVLVRYLKHGKEARKRPMIRKGGFMCCGGRKVDAIDYYAKQIKFLRDQVDDRRAKIHSLIRQERKARKGGKVSRLEGEDYGFVTFKTVAEAHRIARAHDGKLRELDGARIQMAPTPKDILWKNIKKDSVELASANMIGWFLLAALFVGYAVPTLIVSVLANLESFSKLPGMQWLADWQSRESWSFSLVSGGLGPVLQALFAIALPIIIRRICKRQGAPTRSRLDRATTARYYFITTVWMLFFLTLFGTVYNTVLELIKGVQGHKSFGEIMNELGQHFPDRIRHAYVGQSSYWLGWLPLRGFLVFYDVIQLIRLALVSFRRLMFHYTPRDIRELTKPYLFEYHTVSVNLLFVATVALVYAPIAPLVVFGATIVMWLSYMVYKYQLLYVYVSRSESGGRMWNVYVNRILFATLVMQLLMILTCGLIRQRWFDALAGVPMVIILVVYKLWLNHTIETRFRHYHPTPAEAEEQQLAAMREKPTLHSDMERKFLNPALRPDKIFQVMVHKKQEDMARAILSTYPWFAGKTDGLLRGVREENLEYNPDLEHSGEAHDWETRSVASTDMLSNFGDDRSLYGASPVPAHAIASKSSLAFGHTFNRSTDELLASPAPVGYSRPLAGSDSFLAGGQWDGRNSPTPSHTSVPYPPSAYPDGYGVPGMLYRTESDDSARAMARPSVETGYIAPGGYVPQIGYASPAGYGAGYTSPQPYQNTYPPEAPHRMASPGSYHSPNHTSPVHGSPYASPYSQSPTLSPPLMAFGYSNDSHTSQPFRGTPSPGPRPM